MKRGHVEVEGRPNDTASGRQAEENREASEFRVTGWSLLKSVVDAST